MNIVTIFLNFMRALPELIALIQVLQKHIDEADIDRKVQDDVRSIHEAFSAKDPGKLNALFNGK